MKTVQEIFNTVAIHLLTQMKKSRSIGDTYPVLPCRYKGDGGLSCAVGCLISDESYTPDIEGSSVSDLIVLRILEKNDIPTDNITIALLEHLQKVHDLKKPSSWEEHLRIVAKEYKLTMPVLTQA